MPASTAVFYADYARRHVLHALCALSSLLGSCTTYSGDEVEAAAYGYPLDADYATYASAYDAAYTDAWGYPVPLPASDPHETGTSPTMEASDPVSAIRAVALDARDVCPGQVTREPRRARTPCGGGDEPGDAQIGVKLTFMGCQLAGGGTLDGIVDVTSTHSASDETCSASTIIRVTYSGFFTNLAYTARGGQKVVIASLNETGSYEHAPNAPPSTLTSTLQASILRYGANGALSTVRALSGRAQYTVAAAPLALTMDATFNMTNAAGSGDSANLELDSLLHVESCCHPIAGSATVSGEENGSYAFGPSCGRATKNGQLIALDACN